MEKCHPYIKKKNESIYTHLKKEEKIILWFMQC